MTYDLSTSGKCATNFVVPSIRVGHVHFRLEWSDALPEDIEMLALCEYPSTLFLNKQGSKPSYKVGQSYTPR
jgi:hypothetical protein